MLESTIGRLLRAIQVEDAFLFGWFVIVEPLASRMLGAVLSSPRAETPAPWNWLAGGYCYLAALCALACLVTRNVGAPPLVQADGDPDVSTPSGYARLPMILVLGILLNTAGQLTGLDRGDWFFGMAMLVWVAAFMLQRRLPQVPGVLRRLLIAPAVIFATWFYTDTMGNGLDGVSLPGVLAAYGTPEWGVTSFMLCMLGMFTPFMYVMFVVAPRAVAGSGGGSWAQWIVRFALYMLGVALNFGPLKIIG